MHITLESFLSDRSAALQELRRDQGTVTSAAEAVELGCVMVEFNIDNWEQITAMVDEGDLYMDLEDPKRFGIEEYAHVTVQYGLHDGEFPVGQLTDYLGTQEAFTVKLTGLSLFENKDYDVVKFDVVSEQLKTLNAYVREHFPYTTAFPEYKPHMTLAYVKPGMGAKYVQTLAQPIELEATKFVYSDANRKKYKVKPYDPSKPAE